MSDDQRLEAAARALAMIEPGEDWPTNQALGGNLTGTRDDEYRDGLREDAKRMLDAADHADGEHAIQRIKVDDAAVERVARAIHANVQKNYPDENEPDWDDVEGRTRTLWLSDATAAINALTEAIR